MKDDDILLAAGRTKAQDLPTPAVGKPEADDPRIPQDLNLTPQEKYLYQHHLGNLTGPGGITLPNGARETVKQITVGLGNKVYNLPRIWKGKELPPQEAVKRAKAAGLQNFPSYPDENAAQARYNQMHQFMDRDVKVQQYIDSHPQSEEWQPQGGSGQWGAANKALRTEPGQPPEPQIEDLRRLFGQRIQGNAPIYAQDDPASAGQKELLKKLMKLPNFGGFTGGSDI